MKVWFNLWYSAEIEHDADSAEFDREFWRHFEIAKRVQRRADMVYVAIFIVSMAVVLYRGIA